MIEFECRSLGVPWWAHLWLVDDLWLLDLKVGTEMEVGQKCPAPKETVLSNLWPELSDEAKEDVLEAHEQQIIEESAA